MTREALRVMVLAAGLAALPPALGQGKNVRLYEPGQRLRTAYDTCLKDEVMSNAYCVKKCQPDFRLDLTTRPPTCYATKSDARYVPPKAPEFQTPDKKVPAGAKGDS